MSYHLSRCKGCQAPIDWAEIDGRKIPLDTRTQTYEWRERTNEHGYLEGYWSKSKGMINHMVVCPAKDQFKKKESNE